MKKHEFIQAMLKIFPDRDIGNDLEIPKDESEQLKILKILKTKDIQNKIKLIENKQKQIANAGGYPIYKRSDKYFTLSGIYNQAIKMIKEY